MPYFKDKSGSVASEARSAAAGSRQATPTGRMGLWLLWLMVWGTSVPALAETTSAKDATATSPAAAVKTPASASSITLNLKGADLETLVETVAKATGKNFVLDPKVQGKVTVVSHKPVSGDELYAIFLSILEVHGFMAVPVGNVIKIIPDNDLKYQAKPEPKPESNANPEFIPQGDSDEVVAQVIPLHYVDAGRIIPVLRPMLGPKAHMSAHPDTNSLVISGRAAEITRLEKLVKRVDHPFTETIETVKLEHAKAIDVHKIATELNKIMAPDNSQEKAVVMADERTNSILLGGDERARMRMRAIIGKLDAAVEVSGNTRVIGLKYAKAEDLAKVLANMGENYLKENKQEKQQGSSLVNVQAYAGDNSLVISAPVDLLRSMTEVARVLDRRRKQVQVKAIIAEISNDKVAELGVQWGWLQDNGNGVVTGTNFPNANPSLIQMLAAGQNATSSAALTTLNSVAGFFVGETKANNISALLRALKNDADTNILSTPSIVTLDNEEAEIVVGQEVPFITSNTTNNAGNPFQTITRENVGLSLKVKPLITDGDTIRMDIKQEVSSLDNVSNVRLADAATKTRRIKTSVLVEDQQILVLGGLIQDSMQQSTAKVPLLGDLPMLGTLFRAESSTDTKTNLMVFLRPQILRDREASVSATADSYETIRELQKQLPEIQGPVRLDGTPPMLPEWREQLRLSWRVNKNELSQEDLPSPQGGSAATQTGTVNETKPTTVPGDSVVDVRLKRGGMPSVTTVPTPTTKGGTEKPGVVATGKFQDNPTERLRVNDIRWRGDKLQPGTIPGSEVQSSPSPASGTAAAAPVVAPVQPAAALTPVSENQKTPKVQLYREHRDYGD
ncbi:MAG: type II secretion system secretin GspD [Magnetococcales bacterium]|nr:type II secretion system secretin GspD [Magnetococcales bacterium]